MRLVLSGSLLLIALLVGCHRKDQTVVTSAELAAHLTDRAFASRLDVPDTALISSYDPTGGNDDFNHYLRPGPSGWWVLADLKGPGYISRFWFTGGESSHRLRFYFDGEQDPRIDTTVGDFCGGAPPFLPPLAFYENYCYCNYTPLTYKRRLIVMVEAGATRAGGWPRIFHQINYTTFPRGTTTTTFTMPPDPDTIAALNRVAALWDEFSSSAHPAPADSRQSVSDPGAHPYVEHVADALLPAALSWRLPPLEGPAVVRKLQITPDFAALPDVATREAILRDTVIKIYWDDLTQPSVLAPLGDFGGSVWRRTRYQSLFFGMTGNTFYVTFPMPFARHMRLELLNQSEFPWTAQVQLSLEETSALDKRHGYFHAVWRKTHATDIGQPHPVLETTGRGRFLGCLLSATSLDNSFWLLEGDELMWRDDASQPFWRGTGLEDYFTGGWYYQNVLTRALHGLPHKNFFRTVQYRIHLPDVINFKKSFRMVFERGPDHASHGDLESLAWYYLERPAAIEQDLPAPFTRRSPANPFAKVTVMVDLLNYERQNDYMGACEYIDGFLAEHQDLPYTDLLRLRRVAYAERLESAAAAQRQLEELLAMPLETAARQQARMLLDFYEQPASALLGVNANMPTRVMLDGAVIAETKTPELLLVRLIPHLAPGRHVLALQRQYQDYPDWSQLYLRWHGGEVYTTTSWRHAVNPTGAWWQLDYDDSSWAPVGGTGCKGPPEEPYLYMEPNGFVDMQSRSIALRPTVDWSTKNGTAVFRRVFEVVATRSETQLP